MYQMSVKYPSYLPAQTPATTQSKAVFTLRSNALAVRACHSSADNAREGGAAACQHHARLMKTYSTPRDEVS